DGLSFGSADMQTRFFEWLAVYDQVEKTDFHREGPPREFTRLAPLLRRFFLRAADDKGARKGVTLIVDFPEKIVPAAEEASASQDERMALVTFLKWAASPDMRDQDVGVLLITESAAELHAALLRNPNIAQVQLELPDAEERGRFLASGWATAMAGGRPLAEWSDLSAAELATRTAGLTLLRIQHLLAEARRNAERVTAEHVAASKKRLIEEYCQGLVRFKDPRPGLGLDAVATHAAAKQKLRELAWLIKNEKDDVLERGLLVPGRVGVGKSFLIDCFASECGLPVMEMGEFRSKWVGETERHQSRILMTIRALGPVVVVVDEADGVFGTREADGDSVESMLMRSKERAVLAPRDTDVHVADLEEAVCSFIDPLDPELLALQELAAVLACSDRRYLPERLRTADRDALLEQFAQLRARAGRR